MSHELRTPLNSILGFAQLLQLAALGEHGQDNVEHILKGGYHLLDLINEILDLARIESGKLSMSPEPVPLEEILREALDLIKPVALQQSVTVEAGAGLESGVNVKADRQRLKQVFLNLLANAIKFNHEGGNVTVVCKQPAGDRVQVDVCDTGNGISEEGLLKVFTPFERLGADEAGIGGTGLGLALSQRLMEAMGGSIWVESKVGQGSRFTVDLELANAPTEDAALPVEQETNAGPYDGHASHRGTILYIEDNLLNLHLMENILERYPNIKLLTALQGKLGIDLAIAHQPDWILLDVHLPDMRGDKVLRELQADARTKHIPVTVVSADATPTQIRRVLQEGAREYLTKPLNVKEILSLLEATMPTGVRSPV
jgi:CheY-like chemotaxis protein